MEFGAVLFSLGYFLTYSEILNYDDFDNKYMEISIFAIVLSGVNGIKI